MLQVVYGQRFVRGTRQLPAKLFFESVCSLNRLGVYLYAVCCNKAKYLLNIYLSSKRWSLNRLLTISVSHNRWRWSPMYWTTSSVMNVRELAVIRSSLRFSAPTLPAFNTTASSAGRPYTRGLEESSTSRWWRREPTDHALYHSGGANADDTV